MKSLDELRRLFSDYCEDESVCKQYRNCREHYLALIDAAEREVAERYVELPVDADGEVIRIGVTLVGSCGQTHVVDVLELHGPCEWTAAEYGTATHVSRLDGWRIKHAPTIEDTLEEFAARYLAWLDYSGPVGGSETKEELFADFAKRLRLAKDDE